MEASYEIDTLRLVTMSFGLWGSKNKSDGATNTLATFPGTANELYNYVSNSHSKSSWYSIDGGIDYQRLFPVKERMLTFSYKINTRPKPELNTFFATILPRTTASSAPQGSKPIMNSMKTIVPTTNT